MPYVNSIGERYRVKQLLQQLPPHDNEVGKIMKNFGKFLRLIYVCRNWKLSRFFLEGSGLPFSIYDRESITLSRHVQWWNIEEIITLSRMKYKWTNFQFSHEIRTFYGLKLELELEWVVSATIKRVSQNEKFMSWFSIKLYFSWIFHAGSLLPFVVGRREERTAVVLSTAETRSSRTRISEANPSQPAVWRSKS